MKLIVRCVDSTHTNIDLKCSGVTVELGWHDQYDLDTLGEDLVNALLSIGPASETECAEWIHELLDKAGVKKEVK